MLGVCRITVWLGNKVEAFHAQEKVSGIFEYTRLSEHRVRRPRVMEVPQTHPLCAFARS
jgi:hypothetical protein